MLRHENEFTVEPWMGIFRIISGYNNNNTPWVGEMDINMDLGISSILSVWGTCHTSKKP